MEPTGVNAILTGIAAVLTPLVALLTGLSVRRKDRAVLTKKEASAYRTKYLLALNHVVEVEEFLAFRGLLDDAPARPEELRED